MDALQKSPFAMKDKRCIEKWCHRIALLLANPEAKHKSKKQKTETSVVRLKSNSPSAKKNGILHLDTQKTLRTPSRKPSLCRIYDDCPKADLETLLSAGILQGGRESVSVTHRGVEIFADLTEEGSIAFKGACKRCK